MVGFRCVCNCVSDFSFFLRDVEILATLDRFDVNVLAVDSVILLSLWNLKCGRRREFRASNVVRPAPESG